MINRKVTIAARILLVIYLFAVGYICFGTVNRIPQVFRFFLGIESDKVVHFLMFLPFPLLLYYSMAKELTSPGKAALYCILIFILGCCIAAGTEMVQSLIPHRAADHKDFLADTYAVGLGSICVLVIDLIRHSSKCSRKD